MEFLRALELLKLESYREPQDLKRAFFCQAHVLHPDKNPGQDTTALFRELLSAYEFLVEHLEDVAQHFGVDPIRDFDVKTALTIKNLEDIFSEMFGLTVENDILPPLQPVSLRLDIQTLYFGATLNTQIPWFVTCKTCSGRGAPPGVLVRLCTRCFGRGQVGSAAASRPCPDCQGKGRKQERSCKNCSGIGKNIVTRMAPVKIPAGILLSQTVSLPVTVDGQTRPVPFFFRFKKDGRFQIENGVLLCEYAVDFQQFKGREFVLNVPTPAGIRPIKISGRLAPGDVLTLSGLGLCCYPDAVRGDLRVRLVKQRRGFWAKLWGG